MDAFQKDGLKSIVQLSLLHGVHILTKNLYLSDQAVLRDLQYEKAKELKVGD